MLLNNTKKRKSQGNRTIEDKRFKQLSLTDMLKKNPSIDEKCDNKYLSAISPIAEIKPRKEIEPRLKIQKDILHIQPNCNIGSLNKRQVNIASYFGKKGTKVEFISERKIQTKHVPTVKIEKSNQENIKNYSCPFYKRVPGAPFVVDAFSYGDIPAIKCYFLSHFHYDHYRGLTKSFQQPIYCSEITSKLVQLQIRVPEIYLRILPMHEATVVDGIQVTLLDANHCPGSVMFLFSFRNGQNILHSGDFRGHEKMKEYTELNCVIDHLFLDTTYLDPEYSFPLQEDAINLTVKLVKKHVADYPRSLIVFGTYTIGKERAFLAAAEAIEAKIWAQTSKLKVLSCLNDSDICKRLTKDPLKARIHLVPMKQLSYKPLNDYWKNYSSCYGSILAIKPSGWEFKDLNINDIKPKPFGKNVFLCGVPYSEHSSYEELKMFVNFLKPKRITPTVNNGNGQKRSLMQNILKEWQ